MLDMNTVVVTEKGLEYAVNLDTGYVTQVATGAAPMLPLANKLFRVAINRCEPMPTIR